MAGLVVRVLLLVWFRGEPLSIYDERDYHNLAVNLVEQGLFSLDGQVPASMRPPLYPAFVAGVYAVFGIGNFQAVRMVQAAVSLVNVVLLYYLGSEVYNRRIGTWAAAAFCFYPSMLGQNKLLLTETLFTFWLTLACLVIVRFFRRDQVWYLALAGVLIGLGALTRSVLWLLPPVLAVLVLGAWKASFKRRLAAAALLIATFAVTIAPWAVRNTRLQKTLVTIDVMGGRNFMMGNYEHTPLYRAWDAISMEGPRNWYHVLEQQRPEVKQMTQGQRDKAALRYGLHYVWNHPGQTLKRDLVKFLNFWQLERSLVAGMSRGYFGGPPVGVVVLSTLLIFGSYAAAMISGIFGAVMAPPPKRAAYWFLLVMIAYVCGLHSLVFAHSRYHLPLLPLVLLFSGAALVARKEIWRRRSTTAFRLATASSGLLIGAWVWEILAVDLHKYMNLLGG